MAQQERQQTLLINSSNSTIRMQIHNSIIPMQVRRNSLDKILKKNFNTIGKITNNSHTERHARLTTIQRTTPVQKMSGSKKNRNFLIRE